MGKETEEEGDVRLDTTDTELNEGTKHLSAGNLIGGTTDGALDEQRVVMRRDLCTCKAGGGVETDTVTTCTTVDLDFTGVGLEVGCRVFSGDTALNGKATLRNGILGKTELGKCSTSCNLNLGSDDVETSNFLCVFGLLSACYPLLS